MPSTCMKDVEHCPQPRRQKNGDVCHNDLNGVCWNGFCQHTVTQVCESVIGDVAVMDHESMLSNEDGTPFHNCGWSEDNNATVQCQSDDVFCGSLYCKVNHTAWKLTGEYFKPGEKTARLAPDGLSCNENRVCMAGKCVQTVSLPQNTCPNNCNNLGVCAFGGVCYCNVSNTVQFENLDTCEERMFTTIPTRKVTIPTQETSPTKEIKHNSTERDSTSDLHIQMFSFEKLTKLWKTIKRNWLFSSMALIVFIFACMLLCAKALAKKSPSNINVLYLSNDTKSESKRANKINADKGNLITGSGSIGSEPLIETENVGSDSSVKTFPIPFSASLKNVQVTQSVPPYPIVTQVQGRSDVAQATRNLSQTSQFSEVFKPSQIDDGGSAVST